MKGTEYAEKDLPSWLTSSVYSWFLKGHVLPLEVGGYVDTDFNRITRIQ